MNEKNQFQPDYDLFCEKCGKLMIGISKEYAECYAALEVELAEKDKRIAELVEDVRMNSHMVAKLNDETVPEKDHEKVVAEVKRLRELLHAAGFTRQPGGKEKP